MKNFLYILIFFLTLCSCENKVTADLQNNEAPASGVTNQLYFPDADQFDPVFELTKVSLDSVKNYAELYDRLKEITCRGQNPVLQFNNDNLIYNVAVNVDCPEMSKTDCYFFVHHLYLNNDSIIYEYDKKKPIEKLEEILIEISDRTRDGDSDAERTVVAHMYMEDEKPIEEMRKILLNLINEFETLNKNSKNHNPYFIYFENSPFSPGPLPAGVSALKALN